MLTRNMPTKRTMIVGLCLFGAACSSGSGDSVSATGEGTESTSADPTTATTASPSPTTIMITTQAEPTTTSETTIAGELIDYGPPIGSELAVIGVPVGDDLNFRAGPAVSQEILDTALPLSPGREILYLGETWSAPTSVWWRVALDGQDSWASVKYLGILGQTNDITAELPAMTAESLEDLSKQVANTRASVEPKSRVVLLTEPAPDHDDVSFLYLDVIGLGDDSLKGERLKVLGRLSYDGDGAVTEVELVGVERTLICERGVSGGFCL